MTFQARAVLLMRRLLGYGADVVVLAVFLAVLQFGLWAIGANWAVAIPTPWAIHSWVLATVSPVCILYFTLLPMIRSATYGQSVLGLAMTPIGSSYSVAGLIVRSALLLAPFELNHAVLFWTFDAAFQPTLQTWVGFALVYSLAGVYIVSALMSRDGRALHDLAGVVAVRAVA